MAKNPTLILGVGNPLRQDDGIGPHIISLLQNDPEIKNADIMDGGTDGLGLIDIISAYEKTILIDAVNMNAPPGEIKVFTPDEAKINISSDSLSTHGFGIAEVIQLMEQLEIKTNLTIIGIQPKDINFKHGLYPEVENKIPQIIIKTKEQLT